MSFRVAGMFAGIGGFEVGFAEAGHETVYLCENDQCATTVLRHRFPDTQLEADISNLNTIPKNVEVVCAGFPCQNLSMVGDKSGIGGKKSNIVEKLFDLLKKRRVPHVVIENVPFMLHLDKGAGIRYIIEQYLND